MLNWHEYYTETEMLVYLSKETKEPIKKSYRNKNELHKDLIRLMTKHSVIFNNIIKDLEKCAIEYDYIEHGYMQE